MKGELSFNDHPIYQELEVKFLERLRRRACGVKGEDTQKKKGLLLLPLSE